MSSAISHQPPKDDEEEEDEEQGEEFMFDDSTDEEKAQEDVTSECITPVCVPKNDNNEASGAVATDCTQHFKHPSPAGPESIVASIPTTDVPAAESPNEVSAAAAAAEPSASDRRLGEELPVVPLSDSGDHSKEIVQQSSDSKDISEEAGAPEASLEVIYDDVPSEEPLSPDEDMIYEDVQRESGPLEANNGWSSSEFESYDEQSDNDAKLPARSKLSPEVDRLRERCARTKRELAVRLSGKHNYDIKVQQLMRAARTGTKDGLERTKIAVMRKVSFLQRKDQMDEEE